MAEELENMEQDPLGILSLDRNKKKTVQDSDPLGILKKKVGGVEQLPASSPIQSQSKSALQNPIEVKGELTPLSTKGQFERIKPTQKGVTDTGVTKGEYDQISVDQATPFARGVLQGELANRLALNQTPTPKQLSEIADINQRLQALGSTDAQNRFDKEGFSLFKNEPLKGAEFLFETIGNSLASLGVAGSRTVPAGMLVGGAAGTPIAGIGGLAGMGMGAIAGLSAAGLNLSTSQKIMDVLSESGIDIADEQSLIEGFKDENKMAKAREKALKYGVPIFLFDLASGGVAGKLSAAAVGKPLAKRLLAGTGEIGIQSLAGGAGDATGQLASEGKIDWRDVGVEALASIATDVPEIVLGAKINRKNASSNNKNLATQVAVLGKEAGVEDAKINLERDLKNGVIDETEYKEGLEFIEKAAQINDTIPKTVQGENRAKAIELIDERQRLEQELAQREEQKKSIDVAFHKPLDEANKEVATRIEEINADIEKIASKKQKGKPEQISKPIELSIDETTETTKVPIQAETKVGEPKATTETIGTTEVETKEEKNYIPDYENTSKSQSNNIALAKQMLLDLGVDADFTAYSDTNGVSVYFEDKKSGKKIRISDHSVTNKEKIANEVHLRFDQNTMGLGGKLGVKKSFEDNKKSAEELLSKPNEAEPIQEKGISQKGIERAEVEEESVTFLDNYEVNDVDIPEDIEQQPQWQSILVEKAFKDMGVNYKKEIAGTGTIYYNFEGANDTKIKVRLGNHSKGRWAGREVDANIVYDENSSPRDLLELLRDELPDGKIIKYDNKTKPTTETKVPTKTEPIAEVEEAKPTTTDTTVEPPKPPTTEEVDAMELDRTTSLEHAATEQKRAELGLPERTAREIKTDVALNEQADQAIKDGYNVKGLINRINAGHLPTDIEHMILTKYAAGLESKLKTLDPKSKEFDETFKEINRTYKAAEKGGSELGAAFRARQNRVFQEDELGEMLVREAEVNQVEDLTEEQRAKVVDEFNAIKKAKEEWEKKYNELVEEQRRKDAKAEVDKVRKASGQKKSKEDYAKEREKLKESIKEKWNKASNDGTLTAVPIPYAKQLANVAPDVAKLMRSYVEEGVTELADVITNIHNDLKGYGLDVTELDVRDIIAGVYNEKRTRNEIAASLRDLRDEAKLIKQLEDLENRVQPTNEKAKIERNKKITDLRAKIKALKQEDIDAEREVKRQEREANKKSPEQVVLDRIKTRTQKEIAELEEKLSKGDYAKEAKKEPIQLDKEALELKDKLIKLKQEREVRLIQQEYANRTGWQKKKDLAIELLNVPRTVMASADLSAPLRQGIIPTISNPKLAGKAFVEMLKQAVSQKRFDRWFYDLRNSPIYTVMDEAGLYIADPHDPKLSEKEERFMNNIAEKIPVVGKVIKGSERAYVSYLNKMRADLFIQGVQAFEADGKTMKNSPELYKSLAGWINNATGRGKMAEPLEKAAPILNTAFFSPRLMAARINTLNLAYYAKMPKEVRMMALKDMGKFIGFGMSMLALAALSGADVELDPKSTDFGKIKIGDTRYDIWGGFQQYVVEIYQLISGKTKSATTGQIRELSSRVFPYKTIADDALSFIRGKLAPVPATIWNLAEGKKVTGDRTNIFKELEGFAYPLMIKDAKEAFERDGVVGALATGVPATFGIGVQTLSTLPKGAKTGDKVWDFISDKKVRVPVPDVEAMKVGKDKREMTNEEIEKFNEIRLKKLESEIENLMKKGYNIVEKGNVKFKKAEDLTQEQLQDRIESISKKATFEAKEELFGKEEKTPQEKRQERIAERLNKKIS